MKFWKKNSYFVDVQEISIKNEFFNFQKINFFDLKNPLYFTIFISQISDVKFSEIFLSNNKIISFDYSIIRFEFRPTIFHKFFILHTLYKDFRCIHQQFAFMEKNIIVSCPEYNRN